MSGQDTAGRIALADRGGNANSVRTLALVAIAGQVVLIAVAMLLPIPSAFSFTGDNISELVLGDLGFLQTIAFVVGGIGTLALAYVLWRLTTGTLARIGWVAVTMYGVGAFFVAVFRTDRIDSADDLGSLSTTGAIHSGAALVAFLSMVLGMVLLTWAFARHPRWRPIVVASALLATASFALLFVQQESERVGLMQRLMVSVIAAWQVLVALRARAIADEVSAVR